MTYLIDLLNAILLLLNFVFIPAIVYGSQLALGALAVTLVYAILRFSNFATGEMMAFGAIISILITWYFQFIGINIHPLPTALLALPFTVVISILLFITLDKLVYQHHRKINSKPIIYLAVSIGVMFMLNGINKFIMGPGDVIFLDGARYFTRARDFKTLTGLDEGFTIRTTQIITVIITFILVSGLFYFLKSTQMGKAMRAFSNNEQLALLSGINPKKVVVVTLILTAVLTSIGGTLYGLDKGYQPYNYFQLLLPVFASAILGGLGSPLGALAGAFLIAFSEVILTYAYKKLIIYLLPFDIEFNSLLQLLSTEYKHAVSFIILVIVLLFRPTGVFKGKSL